MSDEKTKTTTDNKSKSRGFWNMLLSAADPELLELASHLQGLIPEDSPLRSKIMRRLIGVFKGWAESKAEGLSPIAGAMVEKLTDLGDMMMGEAEQHHEAAKKITEDWITKLFADAGKRLEKAADPVAELDKIKKEFAARMELLKIIEAAIDVKKKPTSTVGPPPEIGKNVDNLLDSWKTDAQRRGYTGRRK